MALNDAVPSSATDVFKRNAEDADKLLNSSGSVTNRLGNQLLSWEQISQSHAAWNNRGAWTTATAYAVNDIWEDGGVWYVVLSAYTSGASAAADIAGPNVTVLQSKKQVIAINSVSDISGLEGTYDDQQISLKGWHPDSDVGGGILYWDAAKPKSDHNGDAVFSPTVPFSATTGDYLNGVGETDAGGSGCWVRVRASGQNAAMQYSSLTDAVSSGMLYEGAIVFLLENIEGEGGSGSWEVVSGETSNGLNIVQHATLPLQLKFVNTRAVSLSQLGIIGGAVDETLMLDMAFEYLNSTPFVSELHGEEGKVYKYNGAGLKLESNKSTIGNYATLTTDTSDFGILTKGTYDNHRENISIKKWNTEGFSDPLMILFADNSVIEDCVCDSPANIGIQVKGDDLIRNVVSNNTVKFPAFHCFATNDSMNFDPAHTEQGQRYPKDTVFRDNIAIGAANLAYNTHSNSNGGMSRVYGGKIINCNQIAKNGFGSQIYDSINITKSGVPKGTTWIWQIGASAATADQHATCVVVNCTLEIDEAEAVFLLQGNCEVHSNTIVYNGTANLEPAFFQLNPVSWVRNVNVHHNTFRGNPVQYRYSNLFKGNDAGNTLESFSFDDNTFELEATLFNFDDAFFTFAASACSKLSISNNAINVPSGSMGGRFSVFSGTEVEDLHIKNNAIKGKRQVLLFSEGAAIESLYFRDNDRVGLDSRSTQSVNNIFSHGNMPINMQRETPGVTSGSATVLIPNFSHGGEYRVRLSTDLSSSNANFLTSVEYNIIVARDGTALATGATALVGSESTIGANFQIAGVNVEYWVSTTATHYITVEKVNNR